MDQLKLIQTFVRVAHSASFAAVAEGMRVSRAMVSKHIQDLEQQLGAQLLSRTTRRISITEAGREFLVSAERILSELDEVQDRITLTQRSPSGVLRVRAPHSLAVQYIEPIIADFHRHYPDIRIVLQVSDFPSNSLDLIKSGIDLAIHLAPVPDSTYMARNLAQVPWYLCAAPSYFERHERPRRPEDLAKHNCLIHLAQTVDEHWHLSQNDVQTSVHVSGTITADSVLVLRAATLRGAGIASLPAFCVMEDLDMGRLIRVLEDYSVPQRPLCAVYPPNRLLPRRTRLFIDFLAEAFNPPPWSAERRRYFPTLLRTNQPPESVVATSAPNSKARRRANASVAAKVPVARRAAK